MAFTFEEQQVAAYYIWLNRETDDLPGDADTDWEEAAIELSDLEDGATGNPCKDPEHHHHRHPHLDHDHLVIA